MPASAVQREPTQFPEQAIGYLEGLSWCLDEDIRKRRSDYELKNRSENIFEKKL